MGIFDEQPFRKVISVTRINFGRWKGEQRIWIIFAFIGLLVVHAIRPFAQYGLDTGKECTGYLLPILFYEGDVSTAGMKMFLYMGCLFLLCDAPFIYRITPYMVVRSRKECWWMGECLYIFVTTLFYTVFITAISTLAILPVATFGDDWGEVIQAFAFGDGQMNTSELIENYASFEWSMGIPQETIGYLYPSGAQFYTFITVWASFFVLALLQYLISLVSKSMVIGSVVSAVFVFLSPLLNNWAKASSFAWVQMLSPVCWVTTNSLKLVDESRYLTIPYIVTMFIVLILLLLFAIRMASKKIMVEVRGEV